MGFRGVPRGDHSIKFCKKPPLHFRANIISVLLQLLGMALNGELLLEKHSAVISSRYPLMGVPFAYFHGLWPWGVGVISGLLLVFFSCGANSFCWWG